MSDDIGILDSGPRERVITQVAPWPSDLEDLVAHAHYRPGWRFALYEYFARDYAPDDPDRTDPIALGTTLVITTLGYNAYHLDQGETYRVDHIRSVPAATYNRASWQRWLLEQCRAVDDHEACEFFAISQGACGACGGSGTITVSGFGIDLDSEPHPCHGCGGTGQRLTRPYAPTHGPGDDPYRIVEYADDEARRTSFRGTVNR